MPTGHSPPITTHPVQPRMRKSPPRSISAPYPSIEAQSTHVHSPVDTYGHTRERSSPEQHRSSLSGRPGSKGTQPERPAYLGDIGSATIHLRHNAVQKLANSDEDAEGGGARDKPAPLLQFRAITDHPKKVPPAAVSSGAATGKASEGKVAVRLPSSSGLPMRTKAALVSPLALGDLGSSGSASASASSKPFRPPPSASSTTIPAPSPSRRPRSSSIHYTSRPPRPDVDGVSYFLPHYSLDREYSLQTDRPSTEGSGSRRVNLELGLGGDFDASFGEAMRNGTAGKEMQLPPQALRALSEAKVSMDDRVGSKQGRKGSITMGLFRETRPSSSGSSRGPPRMDRLPMSLPTRGLAGTMSPIGAIGAMEEVISEEEDEGREYGATGMPSVDERLARRHRAQAAAGALTRAARDTSDRRSDLCQHRFQDTRKPGARTVP